MKKYLLIIAILVFSVAHAQKPIVDGTGYTEASAATKTNLVTRNTTKRWIVFDETNNRFEFWDGATWVALSGSGGGLSDAPSDGSEYVRLNGAWVVNSGGSVTYGTTAGTAAEGNDSRILNGQTAFSWGNHALEGYLTSADLSNYATLNTAQTFTANKILTPVNLGGYALGFTGLDSSSKYAFGGSMTNGTAIRLINNGISSLAKAIEIQNNGTSGYGISITNQTSTNGGLYVSNSSGIGAIINNVNGTGLRLQGSSSGGTGNLLDVYDAATSQTNLTIDRLGNIVANSIDIGGAGANVLLDDGTTTALSGLGGSGHTIQENGTPLTDRAELNFVTGLIAEDNAGAGSTDVSIDATKVQLWDDLTHQTPTRWIGTQAQYDIDFPAGHGSRDVSILDAPAPVLNASDIVFTPNGSIAATDVQAAIQEVRDEAASGSDFPNIGSYTGTAGVGDLELSLGIYSDLQAGININTDTDQIDLTANQGMNLISTDGEITFSSNSPFKFQDIGLPSGILNFSSLASTDKTFTFPNASGTIALTSDIVGTDLTALLNKVSVTINSSTGANLPLGLATGTLAGFTENNLTDAEKTVLGNTSGTNTGDDPFTSAKISGASANAGLTGTEEVLINNAGTLEKTTTQDIADLGGGGGGGSVQVATYDFVNPTFTGGVTGEFAIIPAQGVGKGIFITQVSAYHSVGFAAYTGTTTNLKVYWNGNGTPIANTAVITTSGSLKSVIALPTPSNLSFDCDNAAINVELDMSTDQTLSGTLRVWVTYIVVDL